MPSRNSQLDRRIKFISGRVLKGEELLRLQALEMLREQASVGAIFRDGGTLNVKVTVNGANVSLGPDSIGDPMAVLLNGQFETFSPVTLAYNAAKSEGNDYVYLNYILHRVTYAGENGSIADATLIESSTGELVAEMGQLEIIVSTTDLSIAAGQVVNADTQLERNAQPIIMYTLQRGAGGSITVLPNSRVKAQALANNTEAGLVKLSTGTANGVACATDDPRLSEGFTLDDGIIKRRHCKLPVGYTPAQATAWGFSKMNNPLNLMNDGPVSTDVIYDLTTSAKLSDVISWIMGSIQMLDAKLAVAGDSPQTSTPVSSYSPPPATATPSDHIGLPLGQASSHPARVDSDNGGFEVVRTNNDGSAGKAFTVRGPSKDLAYIGHDGDLYSDKAAAYSAGATPLSKLSTLAQILANHINSHPGGGGGVAQSYVDNGDTATLASAKQYTDQKISVSAVDVSGSSVSTNIPWWILSFGNLELAIGAGVLQNGSTVQLPFAGGVFLGTAALASSWGLIDVQSITCKLVGTRVECYAQNQNGVRSTDDWANIFGICFRFV